MRSVRIALVVVAGLVAATACSSGSGAPAPSTATTASAGCGTAAALAPGRSIRHLTSGGRERTYALYVPTGYRAGTPAPLVFDLPAITDIGLEETISSFTKPAGRSKADRVGAVVVTPQGIGAGTTPVFNVADHPGWPDDRAFLGQLLTQVEAQQCVDLHRVYAMGFAVGGQMASILACSDAARFTAFATVSGLYDPAGCTPSAPVRIVEFHGTADPMIPYTGGVGPGLPKLGLDARTATGLAGMVARLKPIPQVAATWATRLGCGAPTDRRVAAHVTLRSWPGCRGALRMYVIDGGGHTWPGSPGTAALGAVLGPTTTEITANDLIWSFFTG